MKRLIAGIVLTAAAVAGCNTSGGGGPVSYGLTAYGVPGHCYYVQDPAEAQALLAAGLCPTGWAPTLAPQSWVNTYWDYYDSPAYYNTYVPSARRAYYVQVEHTYYVRNTGTINTARSRATYRTSGGGTVPGSKVDPGRFTSGSGKTGSQFSGGSGKSGGGSFGGSGGRSTGRTFSGGGGKR